MTSKITQTLTADGSSQAIVSRGKSLTLIARGTFGAGTLSLELRLDDGTWQVFNAAMIDTLSAPGQVYSKLEMPDNLNVRATLAGATSPSITLTLQG